MRLTTMNPSFILITVCVAFYTPHQVLGDIPETNECESNPCIHGNCTDGVNNYTCECDTGYTGENCEIDIDEGASCPCVHGSCEDGNDTYTCTCDDGYKGSNCDVRDCKVYTKSGQPCVIPFIYKGVSYDKCTDVDTEWKEWCSLTANYDLDEQWERCGATFCEADCTVYTRGGQPCHFPFYYSDVRYDYCTTVKNDDTPWCALTEQFNGTWGNCGDTLCGECEVRTVRGHVCAFPFSYGGKHIEYCTYQDSNNRKWCSLNGLASRIGVDWDNCLEPNCSSEAVLEFEENELDQVPSCENNPCVHGECTDGIAEYTCTCEAGYAGENCDIDIDECESGPCIHGNCHDGVNIYVCTCDGGYTGADCDIDIDECASSPCVNGSCEDGIGNYTCTCDDGYKGSNCEVSMCHDYTYEGTQQTQCTIPFIYKGIVYSAPTDVDHTKYWCSLTYDYDQDELWGNFAGNLCEGCTVETQDGSLCVFPFSYRDVNYSYCTTVKEDNNRLWCSYTAIYDDEWGYCTDTTVCP